MRLNTFLLHSFIIAKCTAVHHEHCSASWCFSNSIGWVAGAQGWCIGQLTIFWPCFSPHAAIQPAATYSGSKFLIFQYLHSNHNLQCFQEPLITFSHLGIEVSNFLKGRKVNGLDAWKMVQSAVLFNAMDETIYFYLHCNFCIRQNWDLKCLKLVGQDMECELEALKINPRGCTSPLYMGGYLCIVYGGPPLLIWGYLCRIDKNTHNGFQHWNVHTDNTWSSHKVPALCQQ